MRIAQIVDSLDAGGAEKIAVGYANSLSKKIAFSALIATRSEGILKKQLHKNVGYTFLNRKSTFDFGAVFRLKTFLKTNKIEILHAHGTSFFIAVLVKLIRPSTKIVWHEHFGGRANQTLLRNFPLYFCSFFFSMVIVVNRQLEQWILKVLHFKSVNYLPNFAVFTDFSKETTLNGVAEKRIVFLANLKNPKNHIAFLHAFQEFNLIVPEWTLHLIGNDFHDSYADEINTYIEQHALRNHVFRYGVKTDVQHILSQASVGVLASTAEGFPVTLLEYGLAQLPVISTNVGFCAEIITDGFSGLLFDPNKKAQILAKLLEITSNREQRTTFGLHLHDLVQQNYTEEVVVTALLTHYQKL